MRADHQGALEGEVGVMSRHEVVVFDADPDTVVSVTVGELRSLCTDEWEYCASDEDDSDIAIQERTCHMVWLGRDGGVGRWRCDACGCRSAERIVSDRLADPAPAWCHRCGARVVDE